MPFTVLQCVNKDIIYLFKNKIIKLIEVILVEPCQ